MLTLPLMVGLGLTVLVTSFLSGLFGMAGGMVLMGLLLVLLPVPSAMLLHGVTQFASNGWRAWLWRRHVSWPIILRFAAGGSAAGALFALVGAVPDRAVSLLILGLSPFLALAVPARWALDARKPLHGVVGGFLCMGVQLVAGISGPLLDTLFVRTTMSRQSVVATKATIQSVGHAVKIVYFAPLVAASPGESLGAPVLVLSVVMALVGTNLSRRVLDRMSDAQFRLWSRYMVMGTASIYLGQSLLMLAAQ
ncbi:TSUP family transporter [Azospirillum picis]|uniref:Probable membrane transporter protein n=1 Tax=Azospirillum picis TaxID=488438 RepID=A0ABU0MCQ0_9PROT|nr:TSUP family transporter [Azospirillum picis]MBP2297774.1 putative membrane protein YfcA [Azospirillum picis]MDQ0531203.1 putative membrane protein YfcA [Azospirillum picis]